MAPVTPAAASITTLQLPIGSNGDMLAVSNLDGSRPDGAPGPAVLYVHGATFASALSIFWRFDGVSWADRLAAAGFDVWSFDFLGFGGSSRPQAMHAAAAAGAPIGRAADAAAQIEAVAEHICRLRRTSKLSIIAHSWGTIAAGRFAAMSPEYVDRLVLFGPVTQRQVPDLPKPEAIGAWRPVTVAEQWKRFTEDVPTGEAPVLLEKDFKPWAEAFLMSDAAAPTRSPPSVAIPAGPTADILAAWSGRLPYDPAEITAPTLIVRGAWDSLATDADIAWLKSMLVRAVSISDLKIARATHLMHLELNRHELQDACITFLADRDRRV